MLEWACPLVLGQGTSIPASSSPCHLYSATPEWRETEEGFFLWWMTYGEEEGTASFIAL